MSVSGQPFRKYHALGNSYIVVGKPDLPAEQLNDFARQLCSPCTGIGSDGVLFGPFESSAADFGFDVYNPDGSRAEISGNGARIFARYLLDMGFAKADSAFTLSTGDRTVTAHVEEADQSLSIDMGAPQFNLSAGVIQSETLTLEDAQEIEFYRVSVGNPHCVVLRETLDQSFVHQAGRQIEVHPLFPEKTNVQFVKVVDRHTAEIEIWERGAGYTLSSGSSATAVAAVLMELGLCSPPLSIQMPGGNLKLSKSSTGGIVIAGPVVLIAEGTAFRSQ